MADEQKNGSSNGAGRSGLDPEKIKNQLGSAVKGTRTAAGVAWRSARFFMPKKWTPKKIAIAAVIVVILVMFVYWLVSYFVATIFFAIKWIAAIGLLGGGLWFIFGMGARK